GEGHAKLRRAGAGECRSVPTGVSGTARSSTTAKENARRSGRLSKALALSSSCGDPPGKTGNSPRACTAAPAGSRRNNAAAAAARSAGIAWPGTGFGTAVGTAVGIAVGIGVGTGFGIVAGTAAQAAGITAAPV